MPAATGQPLHLAAHGKQVGSYAVERQRFARRYERLALSWLAAARQCEILCLCQQKTSAYPLLEEGHKDLGLGRGRELAPGGRNAAVPGGNVCGLNRRRRGLTWAGIASARRRPVAVRLLEMRTRASV